MKRVRNILAQENFLENVSYVSHNILVAEKIIFFIIFLLKIIN